MTPTFHQYVETVSTSHHLVMQTWSPLRHFLVRSFSRFFSWTSARSSTDSGHADTRYSPDEILDARPCAETKRPHWPVRTRGGVLRV